MLGDPFGTAALRRAVLDAWCASPDRFREDANAEEDAALGAYRDRVVVELAQNAADAAARAGAPGRLLLRLEHDDDGPRLLAANTGAPLDAAGVRGLASLRASSKRDAAAGGVGRFGVGAAAVLSVSDDATWASRTGGVRFSAAATRAALAERGDPALEAEAAARAGAVPVLRLPFPAAAPSTAPGEPYDTAVVLRLRGGGAVRAVERALEDVGDALLIGLPALEEVRVELPGREPRVLRDPAQRWHLLRRSGVLTQEELTGLGVEERDRAARAGWSLTWALPRAATATDAGEAPASGWARVLHAPTPTDELLSLPALLVADLPLDAGRRRVPDTPAARAVLERAGTALAELLAQRAAAGDDVLPLVPTGLGAGWVDDVVRTAAAAALRRAPVLLPVQPEDAAAPAGPLRPDQAQALDDGPLADDPRALRTLAPLVGGLVAAPRSARAALAVLEVRRTGLGEVAEALPSDPGAWVVAAAALAPAAVDPVAREQLAALRVPLAGGRTSVGARGLVLLADPDLAGAAAALARRGLRLAAPLVAADPGAERLLLSLGAHRASARDLLADPAVLAAVRRLSDALDDTDDALDALDALDVDDESVDDVVAGSAPDGSVHPLAAVVLDLAAAAVASGELAPGDLPELAELLLPADDGEVLPAAGLVLPGSPAAALLDPEEVAPAHPELLRRWGPGALTAVGVARALAVVRWSEVDLLAPPEELLDLVGARDWLTAALRAGGDGAQAATVVAVRDLDLVRRGADPELLAHLAGEPELRAAVLDDVRLVAPDGSWTSVRSPAATWLADALDLRGRASGWAVPAVRACLPPAPAWTRDLPPDLAAALGLVSDLADLDADGWQRVLDDAGAPDDAEAELSAGLAGPGGTGALLDLWRGLALALRTRPGLAGQLLPPSRVVALDATGAVVRVDAEDAVVVDDACWAQRTDLGLRVVPGADAADAVASVLQVPLSSELAAGTVGGVGQQTEVPAGARALLPGAPPVWRAHADLRVDDEPVDWWVEGRGPQAHVHVDAPDGAAAAATAGGLARALALAAGRWEARALVQDVLSEPRRTAAALVEDAAGGRP